MIRFFAPCIPPTASHHRKRIVRVGRWSRLADADSLVAAKATLEAVLLPHQPPEPVRGPVVLDVAFVMPWRASDSQRTRAAGVVWHPVRPDGSNLVKTLEDRLVTLRFLEDDAQVVDLRVRKLRGDRPGIGVQITLARAAPSDVPGWPP